MAPRWLRNPYIHAAILGAAFTLAFAPVFAWPAIPVSLTGFYLLLLKSESPRHAFKLGWVFAFAHHVTGLYWMANALLTDPEKFAWMVPFAVSLIPAALAVYVGVVAYIFRRWCIGQARSVAGIIQFAALWVVFEGLRGFLFTGFPWNLVGYTLSFSDAMIQPASIFGIYGLSFAVMLVGTAPTLLWNTPRRVVPVVLCSILLPVAMGGYGAWRLSHAESAGTGIRLRLVQANIPQTEKWRPDQRYRNLMEQIELSGKAGGERPDIVIWPETAVSYFLHDDVKLQQLLTQRLGEQTRLITGAMRYRSTGPGEDDFDLYNALEIFRSGVIEAHYEKSLLVPFGEYVPLRSFLPFVQKITYGMRDFARGPGAVAISPGGGLPAVQPLVCYEGIFPAYRADGAKWLINITNDGWFGLSSGPHQHFHMVRMRAVERGVPLVRAANTGISGVVDAYGRVIASIPLGDKGVLDAELPKTINERTIYVNFLERFTFAMVVGMAVISRIAAKIRQKA